MFIFKNHDSDYLKITFLGPEFLWGRIFDNNEELKAYSMNLSTIIMYDKNEWYSSFTLRILGFGFYLVRQNGY